MNIKLLILVVISLACMTLNAQNLKNDSIKTIRTNSGYKYMLNNKILSPTEINNLILSNETAYKYYKKAQMSVNIMSIFAGVGGSFIGYPIGTMFGGGEPQWAMAAIGCGFIALAIPIYSSAKKNISKSISAYNDGIVNTSQNKTSYDLELGYNQNGFGLTVNF